MPTHQRRRRGTRSVRSASVLMPAAPSAVATRGSSQRSTPSPISGAGDCSYEVPAADLTERSVVRFACERRKTLVLADLTGAALKAS